MALLGEDSMRRRTTAKFVRLEGETGRRTNACVPFQPQAHVMVGLVGVTTPITDYSTGRHITRHELGAVLIPPFCTAIRSPVSSLNNGSILFYPPVASSSIAMGPMMRPMLAPGGPATRRDLTSDT